MPEYLSVIWCSKLQHAHYGTLLINNSAKKEVIVEKKIDQKVTYPVLIYLDQMDAYPNAHPTIKSMYILLNIESQAFNKFYNNPIFIFYLCSTKSWIHKY